MSSPSAAAQLTEDARDDAGLGTAGTLASARTLLKQVFGFDDFRPGQEEIVSSILAGQDVLAIMKFLQSGQMQRPSGKYVGLR